MRLLRGRTQGPNELGKTESGTTMAGRSWVGPLIRPRLTQLTIAAVSGTVVGLVVFNLTRVTGRNLFVITGGIAGLVVAFMLQLYRRAARLTEVKVTIPQFSELTFVVNNDARQVAWTLFVETVTRISTQPLGTDEGLIREALTSLHSLFATTRGTLKGSRPSLAAPGSQTVEHMAVTMLNWELRPLLSKWHPRLRQFEQTNPTEPESAWPENVICRRQIGETQEHLRAYALGFARLAGVRDAEAMMAQVGIRDTSTAQPAAPPDRP